jgi:predicted Rossmann-fold nucleotide-binding protein
MAAQVGVMGAGADEYAELAEPLGEWLASIGVNLITGAGPGVMESVCRGFAKVPSAERQGRIVGIIPGQSKNNPLWSIDFSTAPSAEVLTELGKVWEVPTGIEAPKGLPNKYTEVRIQTHLFLTGLCGTHPLSRNAINVLSSDVVIALPGGHGTMSEVKMAITYGKPVICYLGPEEKQYKILGLEEYSNDVTVSITRDLQEVKDFVLKNLSELR